MILSMTGELSSKMTITEITATARMVAVTPATTVIRVLGTSINQRTG
jgi:hypothetical protein